MDYDFSNNKFLKVLIATQRAKQIRKGARPLVQSSSTRATRIAIEEVDQGLIGYEFLPEDPNSKTGRDKQLEPGRTTTGKKLLEAPNPEPLATRTAVAQIGD